MSRSEKDNLVNPCPFCKGRGWTGIRGHSEVSPIQLEDCSVCNGTGKKSCELSDLKSDGKLIRLEWLFNGAIETSEILGFSFRVEPSEGGFSLKFRWQDDPPFISHGFVLRAIAKQEAETIADWLTRFYEASKASVELGQFCDRLISHGKTALEVFSAAYNRCGSHKLEECQEAGVEAIAHALATEAERVKELEGALRVIVELPVFKSGTANEVDAWNKGRAALAKTEETK